MALFEEAEDSFLVISTVNASLDSLLQHHRGTGWPEMVRKSLDLLLIQVGACAAALVQVDTNYRKQRSQEPYGVPGREKSECSSLPSAKLWTWLHCSPHSCTTKHSGGTGGLENPMPSCHQPKVSGDTAY